MTDAVVAEGLVKRYGDVTALDGLSLQVPRGTVLGLLGPNGAGKTTTVRVLTTLLRPDAGRAEVAGVDVLADPREVRRRIGVSGQYAAVDEYLTGYENLDMVGRLYHLGRRRSAERAYELLERFRLAGAANRPVKTYSGGMRRRLDLAGALVADPQVLFLDEPTTGLDPRSRQDMWQVIAEGTSDELKARMGGERLEVKLRDTGDEEKAIQALKGICDDVHAEFPLVTVPGNIPVAHAVRALDDAGVTIDDVAVRRPTLDDVFLTLTGRPAEEVEDDA